MPRAIAQTDRATLTSTGPGRLLLASIEPPEATTGIGIGTRRWDAHQSKQSDLLQEVQPDRLNHQACEQRRST